MKKLIFLFIATGIFSGSAFADPNTNASQKAVDLFNETFTNAKNVKWFNGDSFYVASFEENNIRTNITYGRDGQFLSSRRYYGENELPFNVLLKIKEKYKGKTIGIVTEVIDGNNIIYSINMEDEGNFYVVESSSTAHLRQRMTYRKQLS